MSNDSIGCNVGILFAYTFLKKTDDKKIDRIFFLLPPELVAVDHINTAIRNCDANKTLVALMKPEAQLPVIHPFAAAVYQTELFNLQQQNAVVRVKNL